MAISILIGAPLVGICVLLSGCGGGGNGPAPAPAPAPGPEGEPLIITDMLNSGDFKKAQQMTKVDLSAWGWSSKAAMHSGFMALDSEAHRQTFFWYLAPQNGKASAVPVLLWLQGGPGASSLFGMFTEIGPFGISDGKVQPRSVNWNAWMQDVLHMLVPLMENYKVLIYSGQNDVILGPPLTEQFLLGLQWTGQDAYTSAKKTVWRRHVNGVGSQLPDVCGYVRQVDTDQGINLTQAVVRGAGHMVPGDQPERALDLLQHFIEGRPFASREEAVAVRDASAEIAV